MEQQFVHVHDWFAIVPPIGDDNDARPCMQISKSPYSGVVIRYGRYELMERAESGTPVKFEWTLIAYPQDFDLALLATDDFRHTIGQILLALFEERMRAAEQLLKGSINA